MAVSMAFFATIYGTFYYSRFGAHDNDDQTCMFFPSRYMIMYSHV